MIRSLIYINVALALVSVCIAVEKQHEMCCNSCKSNYGVSRNMEMDCMRGCRLYGMIFLTHDASVERSEIATLCARSCSAGAANPAACAAGCAQQERVFREHQVTALVAKQAVAHGLSSPPVVDSPAPYHGRMFNRLAAAADNTDGGVWLHAVRISVQPLPAGPDGRPRYWVEVSEQAVPLRRLRFPEAGDRALRMQQHQEQLGSRMHHLSHRARLGIRWAACALLLMSVVGLLWLCCSVFPTAPKVRVIRMAGTVLHKQPTSIQSGDIVGVAMDKKPLLLSEAALDGKVVQAI